MVHEKSVSRFLRSFAVAGVIAFITLGLAACGTEPSDAAGSTDKGSESVNPETEWGGLEVPEPDRQTELPASFPSEFFALPEGAVIYNTGERSENQWFIVLLASDDQIASGIWQSIVSQNSFEISDESETVEGGIAANLQNLRLEVQALTIPQEDGSVLLSYDLTMWG